MPDVNDRAAAAAPLPPPSGWVRRFAHLLPAGLPVLDAACGRGRHMRWLAGCGHAVVGVDRDAAALASARQWGAVVQADLEGAPWPFAPAAFGGVVVTHYLWRPLLPALLGSVAAGGVLLYETFARGQETVGRPSNPAFLLRPGELLALCAPPAWRVVAYEDGFEPAAQAAGGGGGGEESGGAAAGRFVQRIAAVRLPDGARGCPPRHGLWPQGAAGHAGLSKYAAA